MSEGVDYRQTFNDPSAVAHFCSCQLIGKETDGKINCIVIDVTPTGRKSVPPALTLCQNKIYTQGYTE